MSFFARAFQNVDIDPLDFCFRDVFDSTPHEPSNNNWILVTEPEFTLTAFLYPEGEWCQQLALCVVGNDSAAHAVEANLTRFNLRAYDRIRGEFFDSLADPTCRIREERAEREQYMVKLYENV